MYVLHVLSNVTAKPCENMQSPAYPTYATLRTSIFISEPLNTVSVHIKKYMYVFTYVRSMFNWERFEGVQSISSHSDKVIPALLEKSKICK